MQYETLTDLLNNEAAAYDNGFFTGAVDAVVVEDLHAGLRSTWREALFCSGEYAYHGTVCDTVYVLLRGECFDDCCLIEMFRKRTENQNAVDGIVFVYFIDGSHQLFLGNVCREKEFLVCNA